MPRELIQPGTGRTNYYEKVCLQAPACEKAWIYERVIGYVLAGYDHRVVGQVSGSSAMSSPATTTASLVR